MPTIIDELVLKFSLDPRGFDEGQRKVLDRVGKLEDGAKRAGQQVEKSGAGVVTFFRSIEHPIASLRLHFERLATSAIAPQRRLADLASQARRTGTSVEAGALSGAAGLRVLGAAGLAAFAALKGINELMSGASQNASRVFGAGLGAAGAGTPIGRYTAISQALNVSGNVPEADTQAWLTAFTQARERAAQGDYGAAIALNRQLTIAGINADVWTSTPEQAIVATARRFGQVPSETARASGDLLGMSPALAEALHRSGNRLPAQIAQQRRELTKRDVESANALLKAQNDLDQSWKRLTTTIYDELTPALTSWSNWLKRIIDDIEAGQGKTYGPEGESETSGAVPGSWWDRHMPRWLGGHRGEATGNVTGKSSSLGTVPGTTDAIRQTLAAAGMNEAAQAGALGAMYPESGLDPSKIAAGGDTGIAQWVGSRKRALYAYAAAHGLDPLSLEAQRGYLAQELSTPASQDMIRRMNASGDPTAAGKIYGFDFEQGRANPSLFGGGSFDQAGLDRFHSQYATSFYHPSGGSVNGSGTDKFDDAAYRAAHGHLPDVLSLSGKATQPMDVIRRAQALKASNTTSNTDNSVEISGGIHVHTAADTATGIAAAAMIAARRSSQVSQANTGLE